jgi:hypothetical protein
MPPLTPRRYQDSDSDDDSQFELGIVTEQERAEEQEIEEQYEIQYNNATNNQRTMVNNNKEQRCEDEDDETPGLLPRGQFDDDSSTSSAESAEERDPQELKEKGYRQTKLHNREPTEALMNPYLIPSSVKSCTKIK